MAKQIGTTREIISLTERSVKEFQQGTESSQRAIISEVNRQIRDLELNTDGSIKPNTANISKLRTISGLINKIVVSPAYLKKLEKYLGTFSKIKGITDNLFTELSSSFNANATEFKAILDLNVGITRDSLTKAGIDQNVVKPIVDIITKGITGGSMIGDMENDLRLHILGDNKRLGGLERYTSQITRDALNQFSRNYNQAISNDLSMQWYYYSGSIIDDTRTYCEQRAGKYFHRKEVENVPSDWSGKIPGTNSSNIFINAGGFNCRHIWMPVLINVVPQSVIDRNIANGNYRT